MGGNSLDWNDMDQLDSFLNLEFYAKLVEMAAEPRERETPHLYNRTIV